MTLVEDIVVKRLGRTPYGEALQAMRAFTRGRDDGTDDNSTSGHGSESNDDHGGSGRG